MIEGISDIIYMTQLFIYPLLAVILMATHISDPMLMSRVDHATSGHTMVWVLICFYAFYVRLRMPKEPLIWNSILSFAAVLFALAFIEGLFQIPYILTDVARMATTIGSRRKITAGLIVALVTRVDRLFNRRKFFTALLMFSLFIFSWWLIGMPVTVYGTPDNMVGDYFSNPWVNFLEVFHWGLGLLLFGYAFDGVELKKINNRLKKFGEGGIDE